MGVTKMDLINTENVWGNHELSIKDFIVNSEIKQLRKVVCGNAKNINGNISNLDGDISELHGCANRIAGSAKAIVQFTDNLDAIQELIKCFNLDQIVFYDSINSILIIFKNYKGSITIPINNEETNKLAYLKKKINDAVIKAAE